MVRLTLQSNNQTGLDAKLNFANVGSLTQPLQQSSTVSVLRFNIPNTSMPIMIWDSDTTYSFTLSYLGFSFTQFITYIDTGGRHSSFNDGGMNIYDIHNLVLMFNTALQAAVTGLNALVALPSIEAPRVIYDGITNFYSIIVPRAAYDSSLANPIVINMNNLTSYFFLSMNIGYNYTTGLYYVIFVNQFENIYDTNYLRATQTSISLGNYASLRTLLITTSMPIESEILSSDNQNSNETTLNVLQSFDIIYDNGLKDILTSNQFVTPSDPYRRVKLNGINLYEIRCNVWVVTNRGLVMPFVIPGLSFATIVLEFN